MDAFIVSISELVMQPLGMKNSKDGKRYEIVCRSNQELATLIANMDTDNFCLDNVYVQPNLIEDIKFFCKQDNLETGRIS